VIALEVELTAASEKELEDGSGEERQESQYELTGELLWLSGAGRLHALELTGEQVVRVVARREVEMSGQDFETVRTLELQGPLSLRLLAEPR
jgi:hypothetical protein